MRKILYITGTRADYGLMRGVLFKIKEDQELELKLITTGMHLMGEFGETFKEIKKDGFGFERVNALYKKDTKEAMASFLGEFIEMSVPKVKNINPDIILVLGDRAEMLGGAIIGTYLSIPVAHIHGGEISSTVDNSARHAITKLSHIHFPATEKSAERIEKMGEEEWRIFHVGAPGLDEIVSKKIPSPEEMTSKYNLDLSEPVIILVQHPVSEEVERSGKQMRETLNAVDELAFQSVLIYPNADAGGRKMIEVINDYKDKSFMKIYKNLPREDFLGLMNIGSVMVGNSSSGIIEAASFNLPVVNIGTRQEGRERGVNVIDVSYNKDEIKEAINKAITDEEFRRKVRDQINVYGEGKAGERIVKTLKEVKINRRLLDKKATY